MAKLLYSIILSPDRSFPSAAKIMDGSENPESISSSIELIVHSPELTVCLPGVVEGVEVRKLASSSFTKSKLARTGVCSGESTVDDESQLDPSEENEEFIDELDEKGDAIEWLLSPNRMFWSTNIFIIASV